MTVTKTIVVVFILIITCNLAKAQSGLASISMSVPRAIFLALADPSPGIESVSGEPAKGHLRIRLTQPANGNALRFSLLARSNTAYDLTARLSPSASQLRVRPGGVEAYSGTALVMPDALSVRFEPASVVSAVTDVPIARGPRISKAGNQSTANNAVVLTFYVEMPEELKDAELILQMNPDL